LAVVRVVSLQTRAWLPAVCEFALLFAIVLQVCIVQRDRHPDDFQMQDEVNDPFRRTVEQELDAQPGQHLVLVRYSANHNSANEYVYNRANIDAAKIVWAREIPGMDLSPLLRYFGSRDVWVFEPDRDDSIARPYLPEGNTAQ
jgi:hypothetical protein